jgi:hypothetical protein
MLAAGHRVVCVNAKFLEGIHLEDPTWIQLVEGKIYTIRDFTYHPQKFGQILIRLVEVVRDFTPGTDFEMGYWPSRFRPVTPIDEQLERIEEEGCPVEEELLELI